jgi:hypothetical protein
MATKPVKMGWVWNVIRMGKTQFQSPKLTGRDHVGPLRVDGGITLTRILQKWGTRV